MQSKVEVKLNDGQTNFSDRITEVKEMLAYIATSPADIALRSYWVDEVKSEAVALGLIKAEKVLGYFSFCEPFGTVRGDRDDC
mgnify:CR=1 FL=1